MLTGKFNAEFNGELQQSWGPLALWFTAVYRYNRTTLDYRLLLYSTYAQTPSCTAYLRTAYAAYLYLRTAYADSLTALWQCTAPGRASVTRLRTHELVP